MASHSGDSAPAGNLSSSLNPLDIMEEACFHRPLLPSSPWNRYHVWKVEETNNGRLDLVTADIEIVKWM